MTTDEPTELHVVMETVMFWLERPQTAIRMRCGLSPDLSTFIEAGYGSDVTVPTNG